MNDSVIRDYALDQPLLCCEALAQNVEDFGANIGDLLQDKTDFTSEDIDRYDAACAAESIRRATPVDMTEEDVRGILTRSRLR